MKSLFLSLLTISFSVQAMDKVASKQEAQIDRLVVCRTLDAEGTFTLTPEMANSCDWIRETLYEHAMHGTPERPLMLPLTSIQGSTITFFYAVARLVKKKDEVKVRFVENYEFNKLADVLKGLHALKNYTLFEFVAKGLREKYYSEPLNTDLAGFITTLGLSDEILMLLRGIYWPKG